MRLPALAAVVALAVTAAEPVARADGLSPAEDARLQAGETIVRAQTLEHDGKRYVGGVTYALVDAPPEALTRLVDDVATWRRILPRTRDVSRVDDGDGKQRVELTQGTALLHTTYTIVVARDPDEVPGGPRTTRFWLDPSHPHGIDDAWGFLRLEPAPRGRTLVTWGVLVDVGDGFVRHFFEERIRALALTVPQRVQAWAGEKNGQLRAAR